MIGTEQIEQILELTIYSGYIKNEKPVSLMITALVEAGKTEMVMKYGQNKCCRVLTDATAYGIIRDFKEKIIRKEVRHIIIPDLIKPMSRGKDTVHTLIAFFNALLEEGVFGISTYAERIGVDEKAVPVKCGIITTMAKGELIDGRHHWTRVGFMSRMLPVSYDYSSKTRRKIHDSIADREYRGDSLKTLALPSEDVEVKLERSEADKLMPLAVTLANASAEKGTSAEKVYGFRLQKQLQSLTMANALKNGRDIVKLEDVELIEDLSGFMNLNYETI